MIGRTGMSGNNRRKAVCILSLLMVLHFKINICKVKFHLGNKYSLDLKKKKKKMSLWWGETKWHQINPPGKGAGPWSEPSRPRQGNLLKLPEQDSSSTDRLDSSLYPCVCIDFHSAESAFLTRSLIVKVVSGNYEPLVVLLALYRQSRQCSKSKRCWLSALIEHHLGLLPH